MVAFAFNERPLSRPFSGKDKTEVREYVAKGEFDPHTVYNLAHSLTAPLVTSPVGILYRQDIRVQPAGFLTHYVTVPYGEKKNEEGSVSFSFDTQGGTVRIFSAQTHIASYPVDPADLNPNKDLIGVNGDNVDGVDIVIPALKLSYDFKHPLGVVTEAKARQLARNTGKTNSDTFRGFAPGELLFLGANGSDGTDSEAMVSYHVVAIENIDNKTIGDIVGIAKKGHEYLWIQFTPDVAAGKAAMKPLRVHVEQVYKEVSFADAFGWS